MRLILSIIIFLSFGELSAQELKCLDFEFYNEYRDVIGIQSSSETSAELKSDSLQIIVNTNSLAEFPKWSIYKRKGINNGFKVTLVNNTTKDFNLANLDGSIIIRRQAYHKGKWTYVKSYRKNTGPWCGNSYFHDAIMESGKVLTYVAPCLNGDIKVKFRFVAFLKSEKTTIYSNEFKGYINKHLVE